MIQHIVIADDDRDIRRLVSLTLRRGGYEVLEANTGDAALDLIQRERPHLAVLDVMMPGLTGLEVATRLSADTSTRKIPLILLSARGQKIDVDAGREAGARSYLVKPFAIQELLKQVSQLLESASERASRFSGF